MISILAQAVAQTDNLNEILPYINLGLAGAFLVAFLKSWIVPGSMYQQEKEERQKAQEAYGKVVEMVQTKMLPEMERNRETNEELVKLLSKALQDNDESRR